MLTKTITFRLNAEQIKFLNGYKSKAEVLRLALDNLMKQVVDLEALKTREKDE